ncbi:MAG: hypothetical protein ACRD30_00205 [Bryobacteraceae bacterium]
MRWWAILPLFACALTARADDLTQKMTARVSEEAEAFLKLAPEVLGTETLHQSARKPASRFHPRVGAAAMHPPQSAFIDREVVSQYGFASFSGENGAIHELRQVTSVNGRKVAETKDAQDALAKAIVATDDARKKAMLKQFEKYGLRCAVTDFGQILLLFTRRDIERYEFTSKAPTMIGYDKALVFSYKQIDGPEALALFNPKKPDAQHLRIEGEIRVRASDFVPLQIILDSHVGDGPNAVREQAAVTYKMSRFGALLPVSTEHRESRGGQVVAENRFTYTDFHKFGASSDIQFEAK